MSFDREAPFQSAVGGNTGFRFHSFLGPSAGRRGKTPTHGKRKRAVNAADRLSESGRRQLAHSIWADLSAKCADHFDRVYADVYDRVVAYFDQMVSGCVSSPLTRDERLVAAAILSLGHNVADHRRMLAGLAERLRAARWCLSLCHVGAGQATAGVDACMKLLVNAARFELDRRRPCTIEMLSEHLQRLRDVDDVRVMVVFLEDCDSWPDEALNDALQLFARLPVCLVAGARRGAWSLGGRLCSSAMTAVGPVARSFQAPAPAVCFESLLEDVMCGPEAVFRLDCRFNRFALSRFDNEDVSLDEFGKLTQAALLAHCRQRPLSALMTDRAGVSRRLDEIGEQELKLLVADVKDLQVGDGESVRSAVERALNAIFDYHYNRFLVMKAVVPMLASVPGAPLGSKLSDVYQYSLNEGAWRDQAFRDECCKWLNAWSSLEWRERLQQFKQLLVNNAHWATAEKNTLSGLMASLEELLHDLDDLDAYSQRYNRAALQERHAHDNNVAVAKSPTGSAEKRKGKVTMREMQWRLRTEIEQNRGKNADLALRQRCVKCVFIAPIP